jgi:hypothetical protein
MDGGKGGRIANYLKDTSVFNETGYKDDFQ